MADAKLEKRCVAGRVKFRHNKDGSVTFTVAGKSGKRFTVSEKSEHAQLLFSAPRALVGYEEGEKNPRILFIFANPSSFLIRQHTAN